MKYQVLSVKFPPSSFIFILHPSAFIGCLLATAVVEPFVVFEGTLRGRSTSEHGFDDGGNKEKSTNCHKA